MTTDSDRAHHGGTARGRTPGAHTGRRAALTAKKEIVIEAAKVWRLSQGHDYTTAVNDLIAAIDDLRAAESKGG